MLPAELLKRVRQIQIRTSRMVNDVLAGQYHSVFKGRGMEFEEVRQYQIGDDIRTIDWNVTARLGEPYVKSFREERELTVMLLVDASGSGQFGTWEKTKIEVATEICALLAFSAITNSDKVGLIIFTDRIDKFVAPNKGKKHVLRVIRELLSFRPNAGPTDPIENVKRHRRALRWPLTFTERVAEFVSSRRGRRHVARRVRDLVFPSGQRRQTDIAGALEYLNKVVRRRAVVFLVSDFLAAHYDTPLQIANRRHDLVTITITDPREVELPDVGLVDLEDAETGERLLVDTSDRRLRARFQATSRDFRAQRTQLFQSMAVDTVDVRTDRRYVDPLIQFFRMREKRF